MKIALVHDWLKDLSGAERVLFELHQMFPQAPIYTLFYDKNFVRQWLPDADIRASFLQKVPFIAKLYPLYSWLMPAAIESLDLSKFDVVISSSIIFPKGLVLRPQTRHICYCYSPSRLLWDRHTQYAKEKNDWSTKVFQHVLRLWDRSAAERPTEFVAISQTVADRIKKYYHRDSTVIHPPINLSGLGLRRTFDGGQPETERKSQQTFDAFRRGLSHDYYLIVSRLFPHKNIDVAIEAFNKIGYPLVIIGDGPERKKLERLAGPNIKFLGYQPDEAVAAYYASCRAFIMPQEEDFGLTPVEAMSYGKPVVALRRGGATETIVEGRTGEFFDDPIPEGLADALRRLNDNYASYNPETIKAQAAKFSSENFQKSFLNLLNTNQ